MDSALENLGWTEEQWNKIVTCVTEEAQKNRVAAQVLPVSGPEDPSTVSVPNFTLDAEKNPFPSYPPDDLPKDRLGVDSYPTLWLSTISINVALHTHEASDPDLKAALVMFRRAANYIARLEDALVFNGRQDKDKLPGRGTSGIPEIYRVTGRAPVQGVFFPDPGSDPGYPRKDKRQYSFWDDGDNEHRQSEIVKGVVDAIDKLDAAGQLGPYACILGHELFKDATSPTGNLVLPRDRILPFLDGGSLLRSSAIAPTFGAVIALSGSPVEIVVASDIGVRFLQATLEPRFVFRLSERVAPRIKEDSAIAVLERRRKP
jgi:uncharacterized linocin/CFP29 family protein